MEAYSGASGMSRIIVNILVKYLLKNTKKSSFGARKKVLPDATANIKIMIVSYFFLIILPDGLFSKVRHLAIFKHLRFFAVDAGSVICVL
jgi:hypothetical protein